MILAEAAVGATTAASSAASAAKRAFLMVATGIERIEHRQPAGVVVPWVRRVRLDLGDVDGLGPLVAGFLLVGDLRALRQRAIAVAGDAGVVHEQVPAAFVGRDEAEALVVTEPLDRPRCHHLSLTSFAARSEY